MVSFLLCVATPRGLKRKKGAGGGVVDCAVMIPMNDNKFDVAKSKKSGKLHTGLFLSNLDDLYVLNDQNLLETYVVRKSDKK